MKNAAQLTIELKTARYEEIGTFLDLISAKKEWFDSIPLLLFLLPQRLPQRLDLSRNKTLFCLFQEK